MYIRLIAIYLVWSQPFVCKKTLSLLLLTLEVRLISKEEQNINLGDRDGLTRPFNLQI